MAKAVEYEVIETQAELDSFCDDIQSSPLLAFDTEFVSEDRYQPELCLLQVASGDRIAIIDPLKIGNNLETFWDLLGRGDHVTVAHAGREEFRFCFRFAGMRPANFFDVQIAAGLVGLEYPAAYSTLVSKIAGKNLDKGETRTDWRRRPLSGSQLQYAAQDVLYLGEIHRKISKRLEKFGRTQWLAEEMNVWQDDVQASLTSPELWRRVSGIATLDRRSLGIVRELWQWREDAAEAKDLPARRVLRDDLMVELAKRGSSSAGKIKAIRGMERRQTTRHIDEIAATIKYANEIPQNELPKKQFSTKSPQLGQLGQFLTSALGVICRQNNVAPGIFCTTNELRQLAAWKLGMTKKPDSRLSAGWRADLILPIIDGLLDGKVGMRVGDAASSEPLELIDLDD